MGAKVLGSDSAKASYAVAGKSPETKYCKAARLGAFALGEAGLEHPL